MGTEKAIDTEHVRVTVDTPVQPHDEVEVQIMSTFDGECCSFPEWARIMLGSTIPEGIKPTVGGVASSMYGEYVQQQKAGIGVGFQITAIIHNGYSLED